MRKVLLVAAAAAIALVGLSAGGCEEKQTAPEQPAPAAPEPPAPAPEPPAAPETPPPPPQ